MHKAKLLDGRVVAVKVQRPGVEPKLLGDIENLKNFALLVGDSLPIDYYKIFCELERTLVFELDFLYEAQATAKVAAAVAHSPNNKPRQAPVTVPLPIPGMLRYVTPYYVELFIVVKQITATVTVTSYSNTFITSSALSIYKYFFLLSLCDSSSFFLFLFS